MYAFLWLAGHRDRHDLGVFDLDPNQAALTPQLARKTSSNLPQWLQPGSWRSFRVRNLEILLINLHIGGTLRCNSAIHISRWKMRKMLWSIQIRVLWFEGKKWNRQHGSSTTSPIRNLTILGFATDMKTRRKQFESCTGPKVSIRATPSPFPNLQWDLLKLPKSIRLQDFAFEIVKTFFGSQLSKKKHPN